ncbi:NAD-dependent epimerase/dehydratase family protein [[Eubacterium] cellulosolvens]
MQRILVTGAFGQIGTELVEALRIRYGNDNVIAAGHKTKPKSKQLDSGPYAFIDATNRRTIEEIVEEYDVNRIYHLAAILSAVGEKNPQLAWNVNVNGLYNILEIAKDYKMDQIFNPSSIAVFGPKTSRVKTPQDVILDPRTMYGITKVTGEMLCDYYFKHFDIDVRGIRFPGIISSEALPGGGTTDYAVEIFYEAIRKKSYTCYLKGDTVLPMIYMPDVINAIISLMETSLPKLKHHSNFNLASMSFSAEELAIEIKKHIPKFVCKYQPDPVRQNIADSWPMSIDDTAAQEEWNWRPQFDLKNMTKDMIKKLTKKLDTTRA